MPYIQLDINNHYPTATKQELAKRIATTYAEIMIVDIRRITVAIRELGDGGIWRITETGAEPEPVAMLMLDIRKGRPAEQRMHVAQVLCQHCVDLLALDPMRLNVEFTQHEGNEMYHPALGGYSPDWHATATPKN